MKQLFQLFPVLVYLPIFIQHIHMHPQIQSLKDASEGLVFMSEADHPFETVHFELDNKTIEQHLQEITGRDTPVEQQTLEYFFRNAVKEYPGSTEAQDLMAQQFQALKSLLQTALQGAQVYRIGNVDIDAFIIGRLPDGTYGGLHTKLIET